MRPYKYDNMGSFYSLTLHETYLLTAWEHRWESLFQPVFLLLLNILTFDTQVLIAFNGICL